jgi:hypothetical protein
MINRIQAFPKTEQQICAESVMCPKCRGGPSPCRPTKCIGHSDKDTYGATMNQLTITATDTVADVCTKLRAVLQAEDLIDEYFSLSIVTDETFWSLNERYRWIACYAVTGGSEGHYIHVDLISGYGEDWTGKALHLITGKTFLGLAHALKIANRCAELLRA